MTTYVSLQTPDTSVKREAGWCLSHTQAVFKAPIMYPSATAAANATEQRSTSRNMPNVPVPVWFDHWGTYQGKYDNWGHVVAWIPGSGFLSSPTSGYGQQWFPSIEAVERAFNAKFRFWSLDINTKIVAEPVREPETSPYRKRKRKERKMILGVLIDGRSKGLHVWFTFTPGVKHSWWEVGASAGNGKSLESQFGTALRVNQSTFNGLKKTYK